MGDNRSWAEFSNDLYRIRLEYENLVANRQQVELQRQQLNLIRQHQGLPPIPPIVYPDPFKQLVRGCWVLIQWCIVLLVVLFALQGIGRIASALSH